MLFHPCDGVSFIREAITTDLCVSDEALLELFGDAWASHPVSCCQFSTARNLKESGDVLLLSITED